MGRSCCVACRSLTTACVSLPLPRSLREMRSRWLSTTSGSGFRSCERPARPSLRLHLRLTRNACFGDRGVMTSSSTRLVRAAAAATTVGVLLAGCGGASGAAKTGAGATSATSVSQRASATSPGATSSPTATALAAPNAAAASAKVQRRLARGINVPWGIAFLPNGNALVSSRDTGRILRVSASGGKKRIGTVPGVASNGASGGEAGLLGLAVSPGFSSNHWLYAYLSTGSDNRVVRMKYLSGSLGKTHVILKGIPTGLHHN